MEERVMLDDQEIRERIREHIGGHISAAELEDWLETESWDDATLDAPAVRLANDALRLLAEYQNGDWTAAELAAQLDSLSRFYWFETAPKAILSDAVTSVIRHDRRPVATGRSPVAGSA